MYNYNSYSSKITQFIEIKAAKYSIKNIIYRWLIKCLMVEDISGPLNLKKKISDFYFILNISVYLNNILKSILKYLILSWMQIIYNWMCIIEDKCMVKI